MTRPDVQLIAFHLPQFHPTPENDAWWGKGFTEWTNVTRAQPLFAGHDQPHLPADLGFYDLRLAEARHAQIDLARRYGIHAFCYHYYWFSGTRLLHRPLMDMLADPAADMPFCLNWANENWTRRWNAAEHEVLIEQRYEPDDALGFIRDAEPFLRDRRYLRVQGAALLMVYRPQQIPECARWLDLWRQHCRAAGIGELHLCAALTHGNSAYRELGFDSAVEFPPHNLKAGSRNSSIDFTLPFSGNVLSLPEVARFYLSRGYEDDRVYRTVVPGWDNTARTVGRATIMVDATPRNYEAWLRAAVDATLHERKPGERLVFVNAWNEWAEGCHLEPDRLHGHAYLEATDRVLQGRSEAFAFAPSAPRPAPRRTVLGDLAGMFRYHVARRSGPLRLWINRFPKLKSVAAAVLKRLSRS
jgi:lipopolysaccharide biosynthesis protein